MFDGSLCGESASAIALMRVTDILASSGDNVFIDFNDFIFNDFVSYPALLAVSMYTGRISVGEKLLASVTMSSCMVLSSISSGEFHKDNALRIDSSLDQSISCASGRSNSPVSSSSSFDATLEDDVLRLPPCLDFFVELGDFTDSELIFEMLRFDAVVDVVRAVDVELSVDIAVDSLLGVEERLDERRFLGGVLNPSSGACFLRRVDVFLFLEFVFAMVGWVDLMCRFDMCDGEERFCGSIC